MRVCPFFSLLFRFIFALASLYFCGFFFKQKNAKTKQTALLLHVHLLLCCFVFHFFRKKLFDGWSCMAAIAQHKPTASIPFRRHLAQKSFQPQNLPATWRRSLAVPSCCSPTQTCLKKRICLMHGERVRIGTFDKHVHLVGTLCSYESLRKFWRRLCFGV